MAIGIREEGAFLASTGNLTLVIPTSAVSEDMMICIYGTKPYSDSPTINNGWTSIGSATDGTVGAGIDTGSMKTQIFYKIHTGTESNPTITNTTNSVSSGVIIVFKNTSGKWITPVGSGGGDSVSDTSFSVTASSDVGHKTKDFVISGFSLARDNSGTNSFGIDFPGSSVISRDYLLGAFDTSSGQDMGLRYLIKQILSISASTAPRTTGSFSIATTGSCYMIRLRENDSPTVVLNTPTNNSINQSLTPVLSFTGTDIQSENIEYNIQINNFNLNEDIIQEGNSLNIPFSLFCLKALSSTLITLSHGLSLKTYSWNGTDWSQVGNTFTITGGSYVVSITPLSPTLIALISSNQELKTYSWNGTDWSQVGNALSYTGSIDAKITTLTSTTIAFFNSTGLKTYSWNGTDWSQVGNTFTIELSTYIEIAFLSSTLIVLSIDNTLKTYSWNGTDWSQVGNSLFVGGVIILENLSSNSIFILDRDFLKVFTYYWNGTNWSLGENSMSFSNETRLITSLSSSKFVLMNIVTKNLTTYDLIIPLISKFSSIPDAGFTAGHPFTSGVQKSYTVQSALNDFTDYYWRVRAIDPTGSNQWGEWSSVFKFTTVIGSPTFNESIVLSSAHTIITDFLHELGGVVNLTSANVVSLNGLLDGIGVISLASAHVLSTLGNLTIEASISTTIDGVIATTGGLDFVDVVSLISEHTISKNGELLLNGNINLVTENLIPVSATLDLVAVLTLLSDYSIQSLASLIMEGNASLTIDETLSVIAGLEFNNSTTLSADNTLTVQVLLTMEQILTLTQNSTASTASQNDAVGNLTLSSANIISLVTDLLLSETISLNQNNLISILNQMDLTAATVLTTDNSIIIQGGSDFINSIVLSLDQTLSASGTIGFDVQINLNTVKTIAPVSQNDAQNVLQLSSDNQISDSANLDLQGSLQLQSVNQLSTSGLIEIILNLSLSSDSLIGVGSENNMNTSILIQSNNDLLIAGGLEMNENLTLQTDSVFLDNNLAEYLNNTMLSLDGQVLFSLDELGDLILLMSSLSQMTASEQIEALAQFEMQINNDVLFQAALDVYDQISLSGEAFTTFEALRIINEIFELNVSSQILFSIGDLFQENVNLILNSTISFIDDILSGEYLKNEIFFGRSTITNNLLLKSLICNMLLQNSKVTKIITLTSKIY